MTVAELIELLQKMPQDARVEAEGCDCINPVSGVSMQSAERYVLLDVDL